jgi:hypothetical protein
VTENRDSADATGTKVFLSAGGVRKSMDIFSGGTYQSSSDPRVHFGLGPAKTIDSLEIHWPSGFRQMVDVTALSRDGLNRVITIQEGAASSQDQNPSTTKKH